MKRKLAIILSVLMVFQLFPLCVNATGSAGVTIDGYYDDWGNLPHQDVYHEGDLFPQYNQVGIIVDETGLYVHIEYSAEENYIFKTANMKIKTNVTNGIKTLWFQPDYSGGFFSALVPGTEPLFWPIAGGILSSIPPYDDGDEQYGYIATSGIAVEALQTFISFYLLSTGWLEQVSDYSPQESEAIQDLLEGSQGMAEDLDEDNIEEYSEELAGLQEELDQMIQDFQQEAQEQNSLLEEETPDQAETSLTEEAPDQAEPSLTESEEPDRGALIGRRDPAEEKDKPKDEVAAPAETPAEEIPPQETPTEEAPPQETPPVDESPATEEEVTSSEEPVDETVTEENVEEEGELIPEEGEEAEESQDEFLSWTGADEDWTFIFPMKITEKKKYNSPSVGSGFYTIRCQGTEYFYDAEYWFPLSVLKNPPDGITEIEFWIPMLGHHHIHWTGVSSAPFIVAGIGALIAFGSVGYFNYKKRRLLHAAGKDE